MSRLLPHRIGGERIAGPAAAERRNPSDLSDLVATTPEGDAALIDRAIAAAAAAQPGWAARSPEARGDILDRAAALLIERADDLGVLLAREEGKTCAEGRAEVVRAARIFRYFGGEALRLHGRSLASVRPGLEVSTRQEPLGVVGLITPWNFPIAIPAWKTAPALAFGNAVVLKPAGITPAIISAMADALEDAGLPPGLFNLVFTPGSVAGRLVEDSRVAALSFTGSTGVGRRLAVAAAEHGKRVQLEMGGKNPLVVLDDADLDRAVAIALDGAFFGSGQRCTASSRLIVTDGIHDRFVAALTEAAARLRVGHALDPDTQIGPVASEEQRDTIEAYLSIAVEQGGRIACGGERLRRPTEGYFLAPALITGTTAEMRVNREEIFGPVASVVRVADFDEALAVANGSAFGLSAGIVTTSLAHAGAFRARAQAGMVMVNAPTAGVDYHVPFGGTKASSMGPREQGFAAQDFYTRTKTAYVNA
ncbi:aldehyde dehydrogenase family protein [Rhizorhabdus wittichii]|uniref:aldehyde dehydrogenase family protein n=1 Tax=Rhizorhabdus wittichii TaxID=160791 RepID=UPI0002F6E6EC|nr:aldehyde dehydrogenase family protein [Rhizorhabdus wittichii]